MKYAILIWTHGNFSLPVERDKREISHFWWCCSDKQQRRLRQLEGVKWGWAVAAAAALARGQRLDFEPSQKRQLGQQSQWLAHSKCPITISWMNKKGEMNKWDFSSTFDAGSYPYRLVSLTLPKKQNFQSLDVLWKITQRKVHGVVEWGLRSHHICVQILALPLITVQPWVNSFIYVYYCSAFGYLAHSLIFSPSSFLTQHLGSQSSLKCCLGYIPQL